MFACQSCGKELRTVGNNVFVECQCEPLRRILEKQANAQLQEERAAAEEKQRKLNQLKRRVRISKSTGNT